METAKISVETTEYAPDYNHLGHQSGFLKIHNGHYLGTITVDITDLDLIEDALDTDESVIRYRVTR